MDRGGYKVFSLKGELIKENLSDGTEGGTALGGGGDMSTLHAGNFFDAIRGKAALTSPIDEGAVSQMLTHYANIASRIEKPFNVDQNTGRILNRKAMKLWSRNYEPGWEIKRV